MTTYNDYSAAQHDKISGGLAKVVEIVTEPGAIVLAVLALCSFVVGLSFPEAMAQLGQFL